MRQIQQKDDKCRENTEILGEIKCGSCEERGSPEKKTPATLVSRDRSPDGGGVVLKGKVDMHILGGSDLQTPRDPCDYLHRGSENVTIKWIEEEEISEED